MDYILIAVILLASFVIYMVLRMLNLWVEIAAVLTRAWLVFLLAGILFYIAFGVQICPTSVNCPVNPCGQGWSPGELACQANYQLSIFSCNTQGGAAITVCHMLQVSLGAIAVILLIFGVAKVIVNVFKP